MVLRHSRRRLAGIQGRGKAKDSGFPLKAAGMTEGGAGGTDQGGSVVDEGGSAGGQRRVSGRTKAGGQRRAGGRAKAGPAGRTVRSPPASHEFPALLGVPRPPVRSPTSHALSVILKSFCHSELALSLEGRSEESGSLQKRMGPSAQEEKSRSFAPLRMTGAFGMIGSFGIAGAFGMTGAFRMTLSPRMTS